MSRAAQAVAAAVRDMKIRPRELRGGSDRRTRVDDLELEPEQDWTEESAIPPTQDAGETGDAQMAKKKKTRASRKITKARSAAPKDRTRRAAARRKVAKRTRKPREAGSSDGDRTRKTYSLVDGIPETLRDPSVGRVILQAVQDADGQATAKSIQDRFPEIKAPSLRFYLGKFQRLGVLAAQ